MKQGRAALRVVPFAPKKMPNSGGIQAILRASM